VQAEPRRLQIGRGGGGLVACRGDRAPDAAPQIDLVRQIEREQDVAAVAAAGAGDGVAVGVGVWALVVMITAMEIASSERKRLLVFSERDDVVILKSPGMVLRLNVRD